MIPLAANPIARALGWTLLHFCWQGIVVALLLWCVLSAMGTRSSQLRYGACCAALAQLVIFPLITFSHLVREDRLAALARAPAAAMEIFVNAGPGTTPLPWTLQLAAALDGLMPWLLAMWCAGVICLFVRLACGLIGARVLRASGTAASGELQRIFAHLRARLGISRAVQLLVSARVQAPAVVGWLRPVVLLPASTLSGLAPEQIEAVLCHELAHIRRHDYLVSVLQSIVETLLFYHPAVWWVSKQIRRERECCCDDFAVRAGADVLAYARALAHLEEKRSPAPQLALAANGGVLKMRIQRLLQQPEASTGFQFTSIAVLVFFAASALGIAGRFAWAEDRKATVHPASPLPATESPASVANPPRDAETVSGDAASNAEWRGDIRRLALLEDRTERLDAQADALKRQEASYNALLAQANQQPRLSDQDRRRLEDAARSLTETIDQWTDLLRQDIQAQADAAARFASPDFQKRMADAMAKANSPEFRKQFADAQAALSRWNSQDIRNQMDAAHAALGQLNTEDLRKRLQADKAAMAALDTDRQQAALDAARAALDKVNPPEIRKQLEDAAKAARKIDPGLLQRQLRQLQTERRQLALNSASEAVEVPAPDQTQSSSQNPPNGPIPAGVMQSLVISQPPPVYPPIAKAAHVQGVVVLRATISKEGKVMNLQVVSGPPMLVQSAMDAVQKWTYRPYTVNGEPIEVETTINVNYSFAPPDMSCTYYHDGVGHEGTCEESSGNYSCRANDDKALVQPQSSCEDKVKGLQRGQQGSLSPEQFDISGAHSHETALQPRRSSGPLSGYVRSTLNTENGAASSLPSSDAAGNPVLRIADGVVPPMVIHQAAPEYPAEAKAAKYSGKVIVGCIVNQQGQPEDVRVVRGVGMGLDEKAREAVKQYTFKPATLNGSPVSVALNVEVDFKYF